MQAYPVGQGIPKVFNTIDMIFLVRKEFRVINSEVFKVGYIQYIIATSAVRINNTVRNNFTFNYGV